MKTLTIHRVEDFPASKKLPEFEVLFLDEKENWEIKDFKRFKNRKKVMATFSSSLWGYDGAIDRAKGFKLGFEKALNQ